MLKAPPAIESEILAVLDRINASMTAGDWDTQRAQFADDADIALIGSADFETFLDATGVDRYFEIVWEHAVTASFSWQDRRVWAHGDLAWAFADAEFHYTFDGAAHTLPYRLTMVCWRSEDGWQIVLYHGSEPAATDPPPV